MSGRKRTTERLYSAEDQALDQISKEAEAKIQARRQARTEAREIRLKEIERQQKEEEEKQKGFSDTPKSLSSYSGSRRGSDDSTESDMSSKDSRDPKDKARELKHQLREMEEKFRQAMVTNAQLDNTKTAHVFQLELLKEQAEEQEETLLETQREYKDKCRDYDLLKRDFESLTRDCDSLKQMMEIKDKLLQESGFVIVSSEEGELSLTKCSDMTSVPVPIAGSLLVSEEAAEILKKTAGGSLGKSDVPVNVDSGNETVHKDSVGKPIENETITVSVPEIVVVGEDEEEKTEDKLSDLKSQVVETDLETKETHDDSYMHVISNDSVSVDIVKIDDDNKIETVSDDKESLNLDDTKDDVNVPTYSINVEPYIEQRLDDNENIVNDNAEGHDDNTGTAAIRPELQEMFLRQDLLKGFDRDNLVSSASFISMESDVTYSELERRSVSDLDKEINMQRQNSFPMLKKDEFDEVFCSVPEGASFPVEGSKIVDQGLKVFARDYVKGVIEKAADQVFQDSFDENVVVRQQSITAENIDIRIPKRHFSEDLMDSVTPFVCQNVQRGSIDILTPLTAVDSANAEDSMKYFSFKVDTEPDVVLTSVDEGSEDEEFHSLKADSAVSGFGICMVGDNTGFETGSFDVPDYNAELQAGSKIGIGDPEFISMSVSLEDNTESETEDVHNEEVGVEDEKVKLEPESVNEDLHTSGTDVTEEVGSKEDGIDLEQEIISTQADQGLKTSPEASADNSFEKEQSQEEGNAEEQDSYISAESGNSDDTEQTKAEEVGHKKAEDSNISFESENAGDTKITNTEGVYESKDSNILLKIENSQATESLSAEASDAKPVDKETAPVEGGKEGPDSNIIVETEISPAAESIAEELSENKTSDKKTAEEESVKEEPDSNISGEAGNAGDTEQTHSEEVNDLKVSDSNIPSGTENGGDIKIKTEDVDKSEVPDSTISCGTEIASDIKITITEDVEQSKRPESTISSETETSQATGNSAAGGIDSDPPSVDDVSGASNISSEVSSGGDMDRKKSKKKDATKKEPKEAKKKKDTKSVKKKDAKEEKKEAKDEKKDEAHGEEKEPADAKKKRKPSKDEKMKGGQEESGKNKDSKVEKKDECSIS